MEFMFSEELLLLSTEQTAAATACGYRACGSAVLTIYLPIN